MFKNLNIILVILIILVCLKFTISDTNRPIIGIFTQPTSTIKIDIKYQNNSKTFSYIPQSYVKFIESSGARVVPIFFDETKENLYKKFKSVNGLLFPGGYGGVSDYRDRKDLRIYYDNILQLIKWSQESCDIPIWSMCLGFEFVLYSMSEFDNSIFSSVYVKNHSLPLKISNEEKLNGKIFQCKNQYICDLISKFESNPISYNNHDYGVRVNDFISHPKLSKNARIASSSLKLDYNNNNNMIEFVSTVEHKKCPIFGSQYHPEKNSFEWDKQHTFEHSEIATQFTQFLSNLLINYSRKNNHKFISEYEEKYNLVYNYLSVYFPLGYYQQMYFFPKQ